MEHISPKFNLNGNLIVTNIKPSDPPIRDPWQGSNPIKTRQELLTKRKKDLLPDPSFDLDGDGFVSNLDLVLSKRFDIDKDGKLNKTERETAEKAIKDGFLNNFKLGLENQSSGFTLRTIQKRGVIIENDNIEKLKETYPMVRHSSMPAISSRTELIQNRKQALQTSRPFENVFRIEVTQTTPEGFINEPRFTTAAALKNAYKNTIRSKMGMTDPTDIKQTTTPSLTYVPKPVYTSQTEMNQHKKKELLESLHNNANYNHKNREQHLLEREKYLISHNEGKTFEEIRDQQRNQHIEYNQKVFSNVVIGVHGKELPKFQENMQEFWKAKEQWVESPEIPEKPTLQTLDKKNSQTAKWLKPIQEFESGKSSKNTQSKEITDKPNHVIPYGGYIPVENTDSTYKMSKVKYRMSTIFGHFLDSAAEMGINFLPQSESLKVEKGKNLGMETSVGPTSEIPKTSQSVAKKQVVKSTAVHNPLRTTGFGGKKEGDDR